MRLYRFFSHERHSPRKPISYLLLAFFLAVSGSLARETEQNWPHLRGPGYDAHAQRSEIALPWKDGKPQLLWNISLGQGYSGIIAAYGKVYTQIQTRGGQYVICVDVSTGDEIWRSRYGWPWRTDDRYPGPYATPTYQEGRIYFSDCYGFAGCMDARNGDIFWTADLTEKFRGEGMGFGYACSPLVENGLVYLPVGGKGASIVALDARTGAIAWKQGDDAASYSSCYPVVVGGHREIVSFLQNVIVARDPKTGDELWRDRISSDGYDEHSTIPLYQEPFLFFASPFRRGAKVLRLSYDGESPKAELVWKSRVMCNDIFSSVLVDGYVYGFDVHDTQAGPYGKTKGEFKCVDLATGKQAWASNIPGHCSVVRCGDKLLLLNERGMLFVIEATPAEYRELTRCAVLEGTRPCWTPPTIYKGYLLVRNHECMACYLIGPDKNVVRAGKQTARGIRISQAGANSMQWLDKYQDLSFVGPSVRELFIWYLHCIGILIVSSLLTLPLRHGNNASVIALVASGIIGAIGMPCFTFLAGKLIFTWPMLCFVIFTLLIMVRITALAKPNLRMVICSRLALAAFIVLCIGFYLLCRHLFILAGIGFLVGFLPAWLTIQPMARMILERAAVSRVITMELISFSIYFWISAFYILWRTG